jgi:hypothetical protein
MTAPQTSYAPALGAVGGARCGACGGSTSPIAHQFGRFCTCNHRQQDKRNGKVPASVGQLLSEVEAERVDFLWRGRIPKGKLTLIEGDPDNGKSALTTDLAARVSVGRPWPDGSSCERGGAVLLNAEDGLADTIKPRLDAAGGDGSRVLALATVPDGDSERMLSIPEDLAIIRQGIERVGAILVVVDPLMAFLSGDVNSHRDQDVRRALAPLARLAEDTGAAVVVVRHLNKGSGGNPIYRGGGSIGIVGAARSALLVAKHPEDESRRVLARIKGNLAKPVVSLAFALTEAVNGSVRVEWKGETPHTADALLATPADPEERSATDEAVAFLRDVLGSGPVWSVQVKKEARKAEISEATLRRAKGMIGVRSVKEADGSWSWLLPESVQVSQGPHGEHLDHVEHLPIDKPNSNHKQENQGAHHEHLRESRINEPNTGRREGQGAQDAHVLGSDPLELCIHKYHGGKGCYLCDPEHPSRKGATE